MIRGNAGRGKTAHELINDAGFNTRLRLKRGAHVLAAAQAASVRRHLRQSIGFWAVPGPGLTDEETSLAFKGSPRLLASIFWR